MGFGIWYFPTEGRARRPRMGRAYVAISIVTIHRALKITVGKIGTAEIDPFFIASFRIIVTGVVFYAFLPAEDRKIRAGDWKAILPLAVTGIAANHVCFASGIKLTTPSHSAVIHAASITPESPGTHATFSRRIGSARALGIAAGGVSRAVDRSFPELAPGIGPVGGRPQPCGRWAAKPSVGSVGVGPLGVI